MPEDNTVIESGIIGDGEGLSYDEFFLKILSSVNKYFKVKFNIIIQDKITLILIVPSLNDVNNIYPLPQPCFELNKQTLNILSKLEIYERVS